MTNVNTLGWSDSFGGRLHIAAGNASGHVFINNGALSFPSTNIDSRPILEKLIFPDDSFAETVRREARRQKHRRLMKRRASKIQSVSHCYQRTGVYLLYSDELEVVYVGQSVRPLARINQHLQSKEFSYYKIIWCLDSKKLHWEKKLTNYYDPKFNKTNRPTKHGYQ